MKALTYPGRDQATAAQHQELVNTWVLRCGWAGGLAVCPVPNLQRQGSVNSSGTGAWEPALLCSDAEAMKVLKEASLHCFWRYRCLQSSGSFHGDNPSLSSSQY